LRLFLDSSYIIYLRYAADDQVADYATSLLRQMTTKNVELVTNMVVIDEVLWILSEKYRVPLGEAFELVDRLLPLVDVIPLDLIDYSWMKQTMLKYEIKPSDALHIASMYKAKARFIASEDRDFDRVPRLRRVWLDTGNRFDDGQNLSN